MNHVPNRVQAGVPTGGQFAASAHHEADVELHATSGMRGRAIAFMHRALQSNAAKSAASRPGQPVRRRSHKATRVAVAALVLAASVSLTACGSDKGASCQAAPDFGSPTVATASYIAPASVTAAVPEKGGSGGGHGGGGHSSGHASSGHASEGGTSHEGGTTGGTSGGSSGGGFHWPWTAHSSSGDQCSKPAPSSNT